MGFFDGINHLLQWMAPALVLALLMPLLARYLVLRRAAPHPWRRQVAVNAAVGVAVLLAGLVMTGRDGKMLTYAALVLAIASSQWVLSKGWRG